MDPAHGGQFSRLEGLDAQAQPVEAQLPVKPESFPVHRPRIGFQGGFRRVLPEAPFIQGGDDGRQILQKQHAGGASAEIHRGRGRNRQSRRPGGDFLHQAPGIVGHDMVVVNLIRSKIAVGAFMDTERDVDIKGLIGFPGMGHGVLL